MAVDCNACIDIDPGASVPFGRDDGFPQVRILWGDCGAAAEPRHLQLGIVAAEFLS